MKARKAEKKTVEKKYVAGRRMVIGGVVYKPGDTSDLDGVERAYIAHLLGRQMWGVVAGLDSLDEDLFTCFY